MIPVDWIRMFSARELQLLISGDQRSALIIILLNDYYLICLSDHRLLLFQTLFQISDTFHSSEWFSTNFLLIFHAAYSPFYDFDFVRFISYHSLPISIFNILKELFNISFNAALFSQHLHLSNSDIINYSVHLVYQSPFISHNLAIIQYFTQIILYRPIDIADMRRHVNYAGGYHDSQPYIQVSINMRMIISAIIISTLV